MIAFRQKECLLSAQSPAPGGHESPLAHALWDGRAFIDGRRTDASDCQVDVKVSPIDGRILAEVASCDEADVDRAVRAARTTFEAGAWSRAPARARVGTLLRFAAMLDERKAEMALLDSLESGKPISDARAEVERAVVTLSFFAECIDKVSQGDVAPTDQRALALVLREAVGVVGAVTPWNYPVTMPLWKAAPALAMGNSVVLKPAEEAPLCALLLADIGTQAGLPAGVFNVVPGHGPAAGKALGMHPDVDVVTFTGSTSVGKAFLGYSATSNMKAVYLECGGKSPQIVFQDAPDMDRVVQEIAAGVFTNAGQVCNAGSRLLVHESIASDLTVLLQRETLRWAPGDPLQEETLMGAVINERQMASIGAAVDGAVREGARCLVGGRRARAGSGGTYFEPTILSDCHGGMGAVQEEIFGPVLTIQTFSTEVEAIALANDTRYGLAASVWTADMSRAIRATRALKTGNVYVNTFDRANVAIPFGGHRESGIGVDQSLHALGNYTVLKSVWINVDDR